MDCIGVMYDNIKEYDKLVKLTEFSVSKVGTILVVLHNGSKNTDKLTLC